MVVVIIMISDMIKKEGVVFFWRMLRGWKCEEDDLGDFGVLQQ